MIKLILKSETDGFIVYDYYVNDIRDDENHGTVKVSRSDKSYEVIKQDSSPFNAWAHAVRFAMRGIEENEIRQEGISAWY
ncbi:TPA: hypothetical protein U1C15_001903 [Streptococcus suis]|nr:hypothetical protein [Streptococcus suis]